MRNTYGSLLIAILVALSAYLVIESAQDQPQVATITGEIQNPRSQEIISTYELPVLSALNSQDGFTLAPPAVRSSMELSEEAGAQLDSMYEKDDWRPSLSQTVDFSAVDLSPASQGWLDSVDKKKGLPKLSEDLDWSAFGPAETAQTELEGHRKWEEAIKPHPEYTEADLNKALKLGRPAPDFTLYDLDDQPVSLSQFKGKVVLLDFWASWCKPCIDNLPYLRKIKGKTSGWPVVFLNVSLDGDEAAWRKAIDDHRIPGVHVRADGWNAEVAKTYQVNSIPSYYLVDSQGLIVERLFNKRLSNIRDTYSIVTMIEESL